MLWVDPDGHAGRCGSIVQRPHRRVIQRLALDVGEDQHAAQTKLGVESLELLHHDIVDDRNHADSNEALGMARRELGDAVIRDAGEPVDIAALHAEPHGRAGEHEDLNVEAVLVHVRNAARVVVEKRALVVERA